LWSPFRFRGDASSAFGELAEIVFASGAGLTRDMVGRRHSIPERLISLYRE
jgi:hypothetical protein